MHHVPLATLPVSLCLVLALTLAGCTPSATGPGASKPAPAAGTAGAGHDHDHDHDHEMPTDLPSGIADLKEHYQEIKAALTGSDPQQAHDPLHHMGDLLEALPELGRLAGLSTEQLETLNQSVDQMLAAYGQVDDAMHEGKTPNYAAVSAELDQALAALEGLVPSH